MVKHLLTVAAVAVVGFCSVSAQETVKFADVADCWVLSNNATWKDNNADKLEFHVQGESDAFYGLISFEYDKPAQMKVQSAKIHFVTERVKAHKYSIRGFAGSVADNDTYANLETAILAAMETEPLYSGQLAGQYNMAIGDVNKLNDESKNLDAWVNEIDVTDYVKTQAGNRVSFIFSNDTETGQNCIISKEKSAESLPAFIENVEDVIPYMEVVFVEDANSGSVTVGTVADTQLRSDKPNDKYGANGEIEIRHQANGNVMYGVFEFALPAEALDAATYEVTSATLRVVCTQNKGSRGMSLYSYGNSIAEDATFASEEAAVNEALANDPIAQFDAKGCGGRAMHDGHSSVANFATAEDWTSYIDVTEFVKGLSAARAVANGNVAFLLAKSGEHNDSMKFAAKEAADKENTTHGFTIKAADMVPQLTVVYSKKTSTGIEDVTVADEDAPVEYYSLQGVRLSQPAAGQVVIRRQGNSVSKIYVK